MSSSGFCTSETCDRQSSDGDQRQLVSKPLEDKSASHAAYPTTPLAKTIIHFKHVSEILTDSELVFRILLWVGNLAGGCE